MKKASLIRTIVLVLALVNQGLVLSHHSPLPFSNEEVENIVTIIFTTVASIVSWYHHDSFKKNK